MMAMVVAAAAVVVVVMVVLVVVVMTGERVILSNCSGEIVCGGLNQTYTRPVLCGVHKECRSDGGVSTCYCQEGYIEVNGYCEGGHAPVRVDCGGGLRGNTGSLLSPNYPNIYPINSHCVWTITTDPGTRVTLTFNAFNLEDHVDCIYDALYIRDGNSEAASPLTKLCSDTLPPPITASSNVIYLEFHSDGAEDRSGFLIQWSADVDKCAQGTHDCGENAFCEYAVGSYRCVCNRGFRGDGKECQPVGQCSCFGDPHCNSFDGRWLHYQGDCHYVMATDGCDGRAPSYAVHFEMWRKNQRGSAAKYSWVKAVRVRVEDKDIRLEQGPRLIVDGKIVPQYIDGSRLSVVQINRKIQLTTTSGLEVTWDGNDRVNVIVPNNATNNTCGLCGNYDGDPDNDWTVGPACPMLTGKQTDNYDLFGRSWIVDEECSADCSETESPPPTEECVTEDKTKVLSYCNQLLETNSSPFCKCLKTRDADYLETLRVACVFDMCISTEDFDVKFCRVVENLARTCAEDDKIPIRNWRLLGLCPVPACPGNQSLDYGPANPPSCFNLDQVSTLDQEPSTEGCFCPDGLLKEGDRCIQREQCGCYHENSYIPTGERVILSNCSGEIVCGGLNQTYTRPVLCGVHKECRSDGGVSTCYCQEGYIEVNGHCEVNNTTRSNDSPVQSGCGQAVSGDTGMIQSPNYPLAYPNNAYCEWTITTEPGTKVQLAFSYFSLEYCDRTCPCDRLNIYDGNDFSDTHLATLCGTNITSTVPITSTGNVMAITFRSDSSAVYNGFQARWIAVDNNTAGWNDSSIQINSTTGWNDSSVLINSTAGWNDSSVQINSTAGFNDSFVQESTPSPSSFTAECQQVMARCAKRFWTDSLLAEGFCDTMRLFMQCVKNACPEAPSVPTLSPGQSLDTV
ncbi:zonadhesin [Elysia marginata]|uniref:Zonadhesin n=1 Tax=Elysia marginata TaxID=1093978 RepID=A0AAV4GT18_9GAST|nr:zonadhesin [Elysia marginata]